MCATGLSLISGDPHPHVAAPALGNVDHAVSYWSKAVRGTAAGGPSMDVLQSVIEKSVVLGMATNSGSASANLADLITTYAGSLATQGRMGIALRYLAMVPGEASTSVAVLKDRIYRWVVMVVVITIRQVWSKVGWLASRTGRTCTCWVNAS
jgi:hypothetical protein